MQSFSLETTDISVVVDALSLPRHWQPFELPEVGSTEQERRAHVEAAWRRIRAAGLMDGDRLDIDVEGLLDAWINPDMLIVVRAQQIGGLRESLYRVTATRGAGVFSQLVDDRIRFDVVGNQRIVEEVTGKLPALPAVPGLRETQVSLGNASDEVAEEDYDPLSATAPSGTATAERREMRKFAQWPVERFCGFELSVRTGSMLNPMGSAQVVDTEGGRYVILPDGTQRIRVIPSDGSHLRSWLHDQIELGTDR